MLPLSKIVNLPLNPEVSTTIKIDVAVPIELIPLLAPKALELGLSLDSDRFAAWLGEQLFGAVAGARAPTVEHATHTILRRHFAKQGATTQRQITEHTGISQGSLSTVLRAMVGRGVVRSTAAVVNGRASLAYELTPVGWAACVSDEGLDPVTRALAEDKI